MKTNKSIYENPLLYIIIFILGVGIIMLYSASSTIAVNKFDKYYFFLNRHLIRLAIGIIAFIFMYNFNLLIIEENKLKLYLSS